MIRAKAVASGVALPRAGSFQDAILQEMLSREQNLQFMQMSVFAQMMQRIINLLVELSTDQKQREMRKNLYEEEMDRLMQLYASELYQERYMASNIRKERAEKRTREQEAAEAKLKEEQLASRVASWSEDS